VLELLTKNSELWMTGACARAGKVLIKSIANGRNLKKRLGNLHTVPP
jgi:hypothetical protein